MAKKKKEEKRSWRDYTETEINKIKAKQCKSCVYARGSAGSNIGHVTCEYLSITGQMRGCSPVDCERYVKVKGGKRKAINY